VIEANAPAAPEAISRFKLLGIVAPKYASATPPQHGVALIAVDGKMPKAYAVGARLDGELTLQSVSLRTASIAGAPGAPLITLELPPPAAAATGSLPSGLNGGGVYRPPMVGAIPQYAPQIAPMVAPTFVPQGTPPQPVPAVNNTPSAPQPFMRPDPNSQVQ
jgi:general secretion pathway protein C